MEKDELRQKAETLLKQKTQRLNELLPPDVQHAIEELYTYQIELELQNEELRLTQHALIEARDRYEHLYDYAPIGYLTLNNKNLIIEANVTSMELLSDGQKSLINKPLSAFISHDCQDDFYLFIRKLKQTAQKQCAELQLMSKNNLPVWVRMESKAILDNTGSVDQVRISLSNITESKLTEQAFTEQSNLLRSIIESTPDLIVYKDREFVYQSVNPAFCNMLGKDEKDIVGKTDFDLFPLDTATAYRRSDDRLMATGDSQIQDEEMLSVDGNKWLQVAKTPIADDSGAVKGILYSMRDITQRKLYEKHIWKQANYDALTGLPNRTLFIDRLRQALRSAHRDGKRVALIFIDLDRFKWVNDSMGHDAGDKLLLEAAKRMKDCARETDTVARLSGDEFTVILTDIGDQRDVERVTDKMLENLAHPYKLGFKEDAIVTGSAGITIYPDDAVEVSELIKNADVAMYRAKATGRNTLVFFTQKMNTLHMQRVNLENDLRRAIENREWVLYYQPIIDLKSNRLVAAEALVRWKHPELGLLQPEQFISTAEQTGLITQLGEWVLQTAASQAEVWQKNGAPQLRIAVNISSRQCRDEKFEAKLKQILHDAHLAKGAILLEVAESIMQDQVDINIARLQRIEDFGVTLSLDDFGKGCSSLVQLKRFPIESIKIEREFVRDVLNNAEDATIVQAIVDLAHNFNMKVVAEGIEDERQLDFLCKAGSDFGQGFYFSRPLPAEEFEAYLRGHHR